MGSREHGALLCGVCNMDTYALIEQQLSEDPLLATNQIRQRLAQSVSGNVDKCLVHCRAESRRAGISFLGAARIGGLWQLSFDLQLPRIEGERFSHRFSTVY